MSLKAALVFKNMNEHYFGKKQTNKQTWEIFGNKNGPQMDL